MRFPKGVFNRCRIVNKTANSVTARIPGAQLITARQGDDCTSSGLVTILSDGNRAIAISGNQGRPTLKQMEEFFHSRPTTKPPEPELGTEEDEKQLHLKVLFGIDNGEAGFDFFIGGDRAVPARFLGYVPTLANVTETQYHGWINSLGAGLSSYRAHAGALALSERKKQNAGCCDGAKLDNYTGVETPFFPPPGWVAKVRVRHLEERHVVVYVSRNFEQSNSFYDTYAFFEEQTVTLVSLNRDIGFHASGSCFCSGPSDPFYTLKVEVNVSSRNIIIEDPEGFSGGSNVNESINGTAVYGITREQWPGGSAVPGAKRVAIIRISYTGDPEITENPDNIMAAYETVDPAGTEATIASWRNEFSSTSEGEGVILPPSPVSCEELGFESFYENGPSPGFPDACQTFSFSSITQINGSYKIADIRLRDVFAGAVCENEWMGETLSNCQPVLGDTYSYCVELPGFPKDPNVIPERKPNRPDNINDPYLGWVGIQGTEAYDTLLDRPGYTGPVTVESVDFSYCSADPMVYQLIYKWTGEGDGQILEAGEGLPDDEVVAEFRDQNWYDWRNNIGGQIQEGRVNSLPVFSEGGTPQPLILPTVRVADAQWVATSPDRTRAIAKLGAEYRLYTGGASSVMTIPPEIATLLTNYPKSINWYSVDTLFVVASDGLDFATVNKSVKVHKIKLTGSVLSQDGAAVDVAAQSLGNASPVIFAVSGGE